MFTHARAHMNAITSVSVYTEARISISSVYAFVQMHAATRPISTQRTHLFLSLRERIMEASLWPICPCEMRIGSTAFFGILNVHVYMSFGDAAGVHACACASIFLFSPFLKLKHTRNSACHYSHKRARLHIRTHACTHTRLHAHYYRMHSQCPSATTVAVRGSPRMSDISPNVSPSPRRANSIGACCFLYARVCMCIFS
jgi:hypothetical protein